uniref:Fibroblast activation protein, alpha n=1 Tax=Lates calcarifer TaxID=8187 RepID=A0A4W6FXR5_LATCA
SQGCNKVLWGVVGAAVVITLITIPAVYFSKADNKRPYTFEDYFNDTIRWKAYNLYWISDKEYLHKTSDGNVFLHNAETNEKSLYLSNSTFVIYIYIYIFKYIYCIFTVPVKSFRIPQFCQLLLTAYVSDFNIYVKNDVTAEAVQVTHNGKKNEILNGIPDWVYEEEVFASNGALWWSSTGKYLAYLELNDTEVHKVEFSWYGSDQYPQTMAVPYPKAGSTITKVKLFVVDATNPTRRTQVAPPASVASGDHILCSVTWVTDERIAVQWLTRKQNYVIVQIYDFNGGRWRESQVSITSLVPFTTCLFVRVMIGSSPSAPQCLTCDLYKDRCQYNSGYFSFDASYYRMDCYGQLPPTPPLNSVFTSQGRSPNHFMSQNDLSYLLLFLPTDLWYQMMLPPNFKKSKKYPLLIDVYAGPCSQRVDYRFKLNWGTYLSSTHGIIIASFDGRGSGYQGDEIMHAIYKRLGTFEVEDQIIAVRKFIDMGFIDKDRIAIWGWSYGGYVTSMALGAGTGLFKCGIAVAPVAKWEYYDAVYTERYMGKPTENSDAYQNSTVTARAKNFQNVDYLLVHGTADDNVHFQQAAQISKALVDEQVDFETMWYTDKDHTLGGSAYRHTYTLMSHFLQKCLLNPK